MSQVFPDNPLPTVDFSLVVSVYNEAQVLPIFWEEVSRQLVAIGCSCEVIFVNDGSTDGSLGVLQKILADSSRVRIVSLSRNFGHEAAMLAGIDSSRGQAVICLDADLQHPPSYIPRLLEEHRNGNLIVHMVRTETVGATWYGNVRSRLFYRLINVLSPEGFVPNASDFFLIDRRVCDLLRKDFRERTRFLRGIIQVVGFPKKTIPFTAPLRAAGKSKYNFFRLCNASIGALATFSRLPLRFGLFLGIGCGAFSVIVGVYSVVMKMLGNVITGYTTIVVLLSFVFAVQLVLLGIIGEYIGFIFEEVKRRPIYIVESLDEGKVYEPS